MAPHDARMGIAVNIGTRESFEIDLDRLPATAERSGSRLFGVFIILFALVWGGFPIIAIAATWPPAETDSSLWLILLFPLFGAGLVLLGVHQMVWRKAIAIDHDSVQVRERGLRKQTDWSEPLSAYRGILRRTRQVSRNKRRYTLYLVDLVHPDKGRTINLYTSASETRWREKWEHCARRLGLPALEEGDGDLVARDVEDLDKSVGDLISEGKIAVDYDLLSRRAEGVAVDVEGDTVVVTRTGPQNHIVASVLACLFPLIFIYVGFFLEDVPAGFGWLFGLMGCLFEVGFLLGFGWDRISRQRLRIGPDAVTINAIGPWGETRGFTLAIDEIEAVRVARKPGAQRHSLMIDTDRKSRRFGGGLPADTLDFVRNAILGKIAAGLENQPNA